MDKILKSFVPVGTGLQVAYTVPEGAPRFVAKVLVANRKSPAGNIDVVVAYAKDGVDDDVSQHFAPRTVPSGDPAAGTIPVGWKVFPGDVFRVSASAAATFTFLGN